MAENLAPTDLEIDLENPSAIALYRWFLASILFGKPVQQNSSARTYRVLIEHGLTSPPKFAEVGRENLRRLLDEGGYARLDYQTADRLHETMADVVSDWGSVNRLVRSSASRDELIARVEQFAGVGPATARIFTEKLPSSVYGTGAAPDHAP